MLKELKALLESEKQINEANAVSRLIKICNKYKKVLNKKGFEAFIDACVGDSDYSKLEDNYGEDLYEDLQVAISRTVKKWLDSFEDEFNAEEL